MDSRKSTAFFLFFFFRGFFADSVPFAASSPPSSAAVKAGYWPAFGSTVSPPSDAALSLLTHVYYAFVQVDSATARVALTANDSLALPLFAAAAHDHVAPVKAILSVGGASAVASANFARIAANGSARSDFAASAVAVAREYGLDGIDIDWEYPQSPQEMSDYVALFSELRRAAAAPGRCLLLTAAVHYSATVSGTTAAYPVSYPAAEMAAELDWVNVMAYDLHGAWDATATGAHAGLFDAKSDLSASYGLATWLAAGMPAEKVVMGVPLYGRTYNLTDGDEHGIGAPSRGVGQGDAGVLTLSEVVEFNWKNRATVVHDEARVATYSFAGETWISYDDSWSATRKVEYARGLGLGGYFLWAIGYDEDWIIARAGT
ncbi:nod factor hydrolase protein 1-like [Curcuma longa]|uniref:nod factor hydrolase protein 1-like n=1 Tax=Curcuma longa TaxID=136217 RepID=UPI003D9F766E